jgi:hypothetical protein
LRLWPVERLNPIKDALRYELEGRKANWLGKKKNESKKWVGKSLGRDSASPEINVCYYIISS